MRMKTMANIHDEPVRTSSRGFTAAVVLVLAVGAFLRFISLDADPDVTLSWSGAFYTDEGWYASNALAKYLNGAWEWDGLRYNQMAIMPVMPLFEYVAFALAGPALWTVRLPFALLGTLLAPLLVLYLRESRHDDRDLPLMLLCAALLSVTDYYQFNFSRLALFDPPMAVWGLAALLCFLWSAPLRDVAEPSRARNFACAALGGFFLALAFFTKTTGILFAVAVAGLLPLAYAGRQLDRRLDPVAIIAGLALCAVLILCGRVLLPIGFSNSYDATWQWTVGDKLAFSWDTYLNLFRKRNWYFEQQFHLLLLFGTGLAVTVARLLWVPDARPRPVARVGDALMLSTALAAVAVIGFSNYQAPRYFLVFLAPMTYFAALLLAEARDFGAARGRGFFGRARGWRWAVAFTLGIAVLSAWPASRIYRFLVDPQRSLVALGLGAHAAIDAVAKGAPYAVTGDFAGLAALVGVNPFAMHGEPSEAARQFPHVFVLRSEAPGQFPADPQLGFVGEYRILQRGSYKRNVVMRLYHYQPKAVEVLRGLE